MAETTTTSATQTEELRNILLEVARTELAALTAAVKFWGGWVQSADKFTQKISDELTRVSEGGTGSQAFVGQFTDASREYLRELIALPNVAVEHFTTELEKITKPAAKRTRKARAKE